MIPYSGTSVSVNFSRCPAFFLFMIPCSGITKSMVNFSRCPLCFLFMIPCSCTSIAVNYSFCPFCFLFMIPCLSTSVTVNFSRCPFCFMFMIQSTLVISNSKGLFEILRDIRTSTYQICRIEEKIIRTTTFNKYNM